MPHLTPEALKRLYTKEPDGTLCVHGLQTRLTDDASQAVVRIVGHLVLDEVPEKDDQEVPEDLYLVLDLPMSSGKLAVINGHFDDTMGRMVDSALERLNTEDGET